MRAVIQRVSRAEVEVEGEVAGRIGFGLLVLVGVGLGDREADVEYLANKILHLRIFSDSGGKMNRDVRDVSGSILLVSQFTLYGDCSKGRRPSFERAAPPEEARRLYESLTAKLRQAGVTVETGRFRASMQVSLVNDGPVTLICDSPAGGENV